MDEVLDPAQRAKLDDRPDDSFYDQPRLVTHADDGFLDRLERLYGDLLAPGDRVFDAMSSWVSHLPATRLERVVGHGLNAAELRENDRLEEWFLQDLNADLQVPLEAAAFDAVLCALSVQYLQYPAAVFREFDRVLAPDGFLIVSFTNRMFPTKAIRAWREATMDGRVDLVERYVAATDGLAVERIVREQPQRDPFVAVVARERGD